MKTNQILKNPFGSVFLKIAFSPFIILSKHSSSTFAGSADFFWWKKPWQMFIVTSHLEELLSQHSQLRQFLLKIFLQCFHCNLLLPILNLYPSFHFCFFIHVLHSIPPVTANTCPQKHFSDYSHIPKHHCSREALFSPITPPPLPETHLH